jgi:hypothetical protein
MMFRRTLESGVIVEVMNRGDVTEIRLIDDDHTAEWIISPAEAEAVKIGLIEQADEENVWDDDAYSDMTALYSNKED